VGQDRRPGHPSADPRIQERWAHLASRSTTHGLTPTTTFLGFQWRDTDPSGVGSIQWFHQWVETGDDAIRQRILDYNEDDCRATRVLVDALRDLAGPRRICCQIL